MSEENASSADSRHQYDQYGHVQHVLAYHERLLSDRVRNLAFHKALKKHVRPGMKVLDIGSGTGVWAIAAARLGASRVVAIEKERVLVPIIEKLAMSNGVSDRLEVIEGDSREVKISGRFDLIVTETVGNYGFDEGIVPIIIDARKRFLKRGGIVIPRVLTALVAPAHLHDKEKQLPAGLEFDYGFLEALTQDVWRNISDPRQVEALARPAVLARVDLNTVSSAPDFTDLKCSWRLKNASRLNCLVVFAQVGLTQGVTLSTLRHSKGWNPICLPVQPLPSGAAEIECAITISNKHYYWVVTHLKSGKRQVQSHSPVFPYTLIQSRLQTRRSKV